MDGATRSSPDRDGAPAGRSDGLLPQDTLDRRHLLIGLARTLLTVVGVIVLYYVLPLNGQFGGRTGVVLVLGLLTVALLVAWQVRAIVRSASPGLRALEATALSLPLFLVLFAVIYHALSVSDVNSFTQPLTRTDGLYFVVTVFTTVGFGDIAPVTEVARVVTTVQMVGDLLLLGLVVRLFLAAVDRGRRRAAAQRQAPGDG